MNQLGNLIGQKVKVEYSIMMDMREAEGVFLGIGTSKGNSTIILVDGDYRVCEISLDRVVTFYYKE